MSDDIEALRQKHERLTTRLGVIEEMNRRLQASNATLGKSGDARLEIDAAILYGAWGDPAAGNGTAPLPVTHDGTAEAEAMRAAWEANFRGSLASVQPATLRAMRAPDHFHRGVFAGIGAVAACSSAWWFVAATWAVLPRPWLAWGSALLTLGGGAVIGWTWRGIRDAGRA